VSVYILLFIGTTVCRLELPDIITFSGRKGLGPEAEKKHLLLSVGRLLKHRIAEKLKSGAMESRPGLFFTLVNV
jgi:hypothetical protein